MCVIMQETLNEMIGVLISERKQLVVQITQVKYRLDLLERWKEDLDKQITILDKKLKEE